MVKDRTTITVTRNTHRDLMLFKIQSNAKDLDEVLKLAISKLKGELNGNIKSPDASNNYPFIKKKYREEARSK